MDIFQMQSSKKLLLNYLVCLPNRTERLESAGGNGTTPKAGFRAPLIVLYQKIQFSE